MTTAIVQLIDQDYVIAAEGSETFATAVIQAIAAAADSESSAQAAENAETGAEIAAAAVGVFPTIAEGEAATVDGQSFYVAEGGEVTLYRNVGGAAVEAAALPSAAAVAARVPYAELASTDIPLGASLMGDKLNATGAVGLTQHEINSEAPTAKRFGAIGDGVTDDSTALSAAYVLRVTPGDYLASSLTRTESFSMDEGANLLFNGAENGTLLDFTGSGKSIPSLNASGLSQNCTLAKISGDNNQIGTARLADVTASTTGITSLYGLALLGDGNTVDRVEIRNFENTGLANESFPQGVFFFGDNNHVGTIFADGAAAAVSTSSASGRNTVGRMVLRNVNDNGIYHLGGQLIVESVDYEGPNEPFVSKGGPTASLHIGRCIHNGTGIPGVENSGDVTIDHLHIGENAGSILRTRAGQTASGRIHIGKLTGDFAGGSLWGMNVGTIEYLTIDEMDIIYRYDSTTAGPISSWADFSGCKGFRFGTIRIRIIDVNDALVSATDTFTLRAPTTNLEYESFVGEIIVTIEKGSDGTPSPARMRGVGFFNSPLIHVENAFIENTGTTSGPFLREVIESVSFNGLVQRSALAPSAGTWRRGEIIRNYEPSVGGSSGWVCTAAGNPGTWEELGIVGATRAGSLNPGTATSADIVNALKAAGLMA